MIYILEKNLIAEQTVYTSKFGEKRIEKSGKEIKAISKEMTLEQLEVFCKTSPVDIDLLFDFGDKGIFKTVESRSQFDEPFKIESGISIEKFKGEIPELQKGVVETVRPNSLFNKSKLFSRIRIFKDFQKKETLNCANMENHLRILVVLSSHYLNIPLFRINEH